MAIKITIQQNINKNKKNRRATYGTPFNSVFPLFFSKKWHFTNGTRNRINWYWYSGRRKSNSESSLEFDLNSDNNDKNNDSNTFDLIGYILNKAKDNIMLNH